MRARLRSVFRVLLRRQEFESGAVEEMEFHIRQYAADLERSGVPPAALLYGVEPHDPAPIGIAVIVLCFAGAVAAWAPTRRALSMDPARVLNDGSLP